MAGVAIASYAGIHFSRIINYKLSILGYPPFSETSI